MTQQKPCIATDLILNVLSLTNIFAHAEHVGLDGVEMPIPNYQTLMLPLLRHAARGETSVPNVESQIADEFGLTQTERDQLLPSGRQKVLHNRIHWAKFYLSKAGLVEQPRRGRFLASDEGRRLLARNLDQIGLDILLEYPSFQAFYQDTTDASTSTQ